MKTKSFILLFALVAFGFISCDKNENTQLDVFGNDLMSQLPKEKIEIVDFNGTGVDFIITPIAESPQLRSSGDESLSATVSYEISTQFSDGEVLTTKLSLMPNDDGTVRTVHSLYDYTLAVLLYDNQGALIDIRLPEDEFFPLDPEFKRVYACLNDQYQKMVDIISKDMANNIVCNMTWPICHGLIVMTAVEICKGNIPKF